MATSVEIVSRQHDLKPGKRRAAVTAGCASTGPRCAASPRWAISSHAALRLDEKELAPRFEADVEEHDDIEVLRRAARKARARSARSPSSRTRSTASCGSSACRIVPIEELLPERHAADLQRNPQGLVRTYRSTRRIAAALLDRYVHVAQGGGRRRAASGRAPGSSSWWASTGRTRSCCRPRRRRRQCSSRTSRASTANHGGASSPASASCGLQRHLPGVGSGHGLDDIGRDFSCAPRREGLVPASSSRRPRG